VALPGGSNIATLGSSNGITSDTGGTVDAVNCAP